jgi:hypothetical protein
MCDRPPCLSLRAFAAPNRERKRVGHYFRPWLTSGLLIRPVLWGCLVYASGGFSTLSLPQIPSHSASKYPQLKQSTNLSRHPKPHSPRSYSTPRDNGTEGHHPLKCLPPQTSLALPPPYPTRGWAPPNPHPTNYQRNLVPFPHTFVSRRPMFRPVTNLS